MSALELIDVNYSYHTKTGETAALSNINFSVEKGSFVSIVGPSGCGKSTLLSLISGTILPSSGRILINGSTDESAKASIGYMLQHDQLFEWRSVFGNVVLGLEISHKKKEALANELLSRYGLSDFSNAKPSELSGGMRQRVALIRTLVLEPDILLLDEPFSALDYLTRLTVCDEIASIIKKEHKTAVLVTHDLAEAISVGDIVYVLSKRPGRIIAQIPLTNLPQELSPMERRNASEFKDYFNMIWKELRKNE